jgi:hypothetical protein
MKGKTSIRINCIRESYNQIWDKNCKVTPIQAMKALGRNGGTPPLILISVTRYK